MRTVRPTTEKIRCMEDGGRGLSRPQDAKGQGKTLLVILVKLKEERLEQVPNLPSY